MEIYSLPVLEEEDDARNDATRVRTMTLQGAVMKVVSREKVWRKVCEAFVGKEKKGK